ncbi:MAG TPA: hypothetical protein VK745_16445 [Polyangiaceae bacterium]|nr:hypothetical protein [Polyangiaceae bacterium]
MKSQFAQVAADAGASGLPLTIPEELWSKITPDQQERCIAAQRVLGAFAGDRDLDLTDLADRLEAEPEDVLGGLHVLDAMSLVTSEESEAGPRFHLRALPDEHVRFVGPNGRTQWLFVARPLDPPEIEADSLN